MTTETRRYDQNGHAHDPRAHEGPEDRRSRQTTFERGVALALASGMLRDLRDLRTLSEGLRWIVRSGELDQAEAMLTHLREDILRAERIEERAEDA